MNITTKKTVKNHVDNIDFLTLFISHWGYAAIFCW